MPRQHATRQPVLTSAEVVARTSAALATFTSTALATLMLAVGAIAQSAAQGAEPSASGAAAATTQPASGATTQPTDAEPTLSSPPLMRAQQAAPSLEQTRASVSRGIDYLLASQNASGSWGSHRNDLATEFWSNYATHVSWQVATTGLCVRALHEAATSDADRARVRPAIDRGIDFILENALVRRPNTWDTDNTWAYVYGLQAMASLHASGIYRDTPRQARLAQVSAEVVRKLALYQTPMGGWGYYDSFESVTRTPNWATSFMTANAILALEESRQQGFAVDARMLEIAVKALRRCRLPNGAYTYSMDTIRTTDGTEGINQVQGSLSRIAVCNLALFASEDGGISQDDLRVGTAQFFRFHRFLEVARKRPIPHEAYHYNSGYFYFYGHYYVARVIIQLSPEDQAKFWPALRYHIVRTQERDGSWWDYHMGSYHKPYATAYSLMALTLSLAPSATP